MPRPLNGLTASREAVVAAMAAAKRFSSQSDKFQACVQNFLGGHRLKPGTEEVNLPLVIIENHRVLASRNNNRLVAAQTRTAINDFNEYGNDCSG